ncbi:MAG: cardiolipin synthase [Gemmatimonadota bacterium]|nr:cardiolipin synthase [Gemmatimonadota bacterium]
MGWREWSVFNLSTTEITVIGIALAVVEVIAIASAVRAVMTARTSQGALAWIGALITLPVISVPLYWIFGRARFHGYVDVRRERLEGMNELIGDVTPRVSEYVVVAPPGLGAGLVLPELASLPFTRGNHTELLVNGEETFDAIFDLIDSAERYLLSQFFIVNDDELGRKYKERLIARAREGVDVYFLYDEIGSRKMTRRYLADLRAAGVHVTGINTTRGFTNRFQVNFRNHRKIVLADAKAAIVGGLNVGDEYMDLDRKLTPWRDTAILLEGPEVLACQLTFVEDWHWATGEVPRLSWEPRASTKSDRVAFVLPSGPADEFETCSLFFRHAANTAKRRLWIATPYFVPDEGTIGALELAAMRGVDVRILMPGLPDKPFIKLAGLSYVAEMARAGVKMFEYGDGFMHQKVMLLDDNVCSIGTANFDNRSFRLNFEISIVTADEGFAAEVEQMLLADLEKSTLIDAADVASRPIPFKVGSRVARLFSPIL